jgi:Na+-driven multidrug efflux pump
MQIIGYALGAALSGIVANLCGLGEGASAEAAGRAAVWVFVAFLPLGGLGIWASRRFTAEPAVAG